MPARRQEVCEQLAIAEDCREHRVNDPSGLPGRRGRRLKALRCVNPGSAA
jgi:hypothetical protein